MAGFKHGPSGRRDQAWLDDHPFERLKAITRLQDGILHDGGGRNLQCPTCQWIRDKKKIDIPTNRLKIDIGKLPNTLVVRCERSRHNQNRLVRAVTKATGISLTPRPSPSEIRERMLHWVGEMRRSPAYKNLWPKAKAVVDILVAAVVDGGLPNGEIAQSKKEWMTVLKTRSSRATNKAIADALASGLIGRRRTQSPTLEGGRPSFLYGLQRLPTGKVCKWSKTNSTDEASRGPKPGPKPSKVGPKSPLISLSPISSRTQS
jgi:hypothetical protein